jgi:hypothetical protein
MFMSFSVLAVSVYFIACHGGPADHFSTFAEELGKRGHTVQILANGPALDKFRARGLQNLCSFEIEDKEIRIAEEIAKSCAVADVVITDVGHSFDVLLQEALAKHAPKSFKWAYYDNPEAYVPGGYSEVAEKVMKAAQGILFANVNLLPHYESADWASKKRVGLGYYPVAQAERIAARRKNEHGTLQKELFGNQKVLVYTGGNNEVYFQEAFPAFLRFLKEGAERYPLSDWTILLQQHPGARAKKIDEKQIEEWVAQYGKNENSPKLMISKLSSEEAQIVADAILYYQTSMGPQFALAGIPTVQVGHEVYRDILVENQLCAIATDADQFIEAIEQLQRGGQNQSADVGVIQQRLGLQPDWANRLENAIKK